MNVRIKTVLLQLIAYTLFVIALSAPCSMAYAADEIPDTLNTLNIVIGQAFLDAKSRRAKSKSPQTHIPVSIREKVTTGVAATTAAVSGMVRKFREYSAPVQIGAVLFLALVGNKAWETRLFGTVDMVTDWYQWLFPEAKVVLMNALQTHYSSIGKPHAVGLATFLVEAAPVKDLGIINARFLILNIDAKLAAFCSQQGVSEAELFSQSFSELLNLFIYQVLHYRSGNETEAELKEEVRLRIAEENGQKSYDKVCPASVEAYCNYARWQGKPCQVFFDQSSNFKVGQSSEGFMQNRPANETWPANAQWQSYDYFSFLQKSNPGL